MAQPARNPAIKQRAGISQRHRPSQYAGAKKIAIPTADSTTWPNGAWLNHSAARCHAFIFPALLDRPQFKIETHFTRWASTVNDDGKQVLF